MRIAVFHNLPSGGAKRALYGLVKYLTMLGCVVDVFVPSTADETFLPLSQLLDNVKVYQVKKTLRGLVKSATRYIVPASTQGVFLADLEETQRIIAAVINRSDCDVAFIEQDRYTISPYILRYIAKPHVYYCPQPRRSEEILRRLSVSAGNTTLLRRVWRWYVIPRLEIIDKENASCAKWILTNSYFSREAILRAYGMNSYVSYLGVDTGLFRPSTISRSPFVLSVGALIPAKGYDFIIRALSLIDENVRPRLIIVSNKVWKPYEDFLKRLAAERRVLLEVRVLIDDLHLVELYREAALCVYAPYLEPFGLVPLEAMACGTPVVAVKEGGIRESVVHGYGGLLSERDEKEFAEAVSWLLLDKETHQRMSRDAVEAIRSFWTLEHAARRLLRHLERVIQDS